MKRADSGKLLCAACNIFQLTLGPIPDARSEKEKRVFNDSSIYNRTWYNSISYISIDTW